MVKIIIVRHGESFGNSLRIMAGHTDVELTDRGREQAKATALALRGESIDAIYSSDLARAYHTALPHAAFCGLEVIRDEGLREIFLGDYEGMKIADVTEKIDPGFGCYWGDGFGTYAFPGGETPVGAGERFYFTLEKIAKKNEGKTVLIATHAAVIRAFWGKICGITAENLGREVPFPTNASYSVVEYENGVFVPKIFSENRHLEAIGFLDTHNKEI